MLKFNQKRKVDLFTFLFSVPLGSIPELPAESCKEIKASEGGKAVSGKYWLNSVVKDKSVIAYCDMDTEGNYLTNNFFALFVRVTFSIVGKHSKSSIVPLSPHKLQQHPFYPNLEL